MFPTVRSLNTTHQLCDVKPDRRRTSRNGWSMSTESFTDYVELNVHNWAVRGVRSSPSRQCRRYDKLLELWHSIGIHRRFECRTIRICS
jgi:hypothetical protein